MSHCPVPTELHRTFVPRQPRPAPAINCARANPPPASYRLEGDTNQGKQHHHQQLIIISSGCSVVLALARPVGPKNPSRPAIERSEMGSCFSSSGSAGDDAGDERRVRRVWPSDDDGGEWDPDVDSRAANYIAKFHRHQSGVVCSDCATDQQQQTPAATAAQ